MSPRAIPKTALVTGASRGVGRGIVLGLAENGFRVAATGRRIFESDLPEGVLRLPCDHLDDAQTQAVFEQVDAFENGLGMLVNNCWGGYERMVEEGRFTWNAPFWQQPLHRWAAMMEVGVRSAYVCSSHAARRMVPRKSGLIVNISFWAAQTHLGNAIYGIAKAATDKLTADSAAELAPHGVAVVSLYPGLVRTEAVMEAGASLDLSNSESPQFLGRVIAGLARSDDLLARSGQVLVAAQIAQELGIEDIDGRQPRPLSLASVKS